jgi:hypothetical protein
MATLHIKTHTLNCSENSYFCLCSTHTHTHTHTLASLQWNNFNPNYSTRIFLNPQVLLIHSTQNLPFRRTLCPAFTLFKLSWLQTVSKLSRKKASVLFLFFYILSNIIKCLYWLVESILTLKIIKLAYHFLY